MILQRGGRALRVPFASCTAISPPVTLPAFLVPAVFQAGARIAITLQGRKFSATPKAASKLGRIPLSIPPGVEFTLSEPRIKPDPTTYLKVARRTATIKGPLGAVEHELPEYVNLNLDEQNKRITLAVENKDVRGQRAMWGTTWSYLNSHILGVSEGHTAILRLVGVGFRATIENRKNREEYPDQKFVCLKLGFTHPVELGVPKGVTATVPQPTRILLEGCNKEVVMQFAAQIRWWRRPEPYKGKGIFVNDETIKLKQKKIK